VRLLLKWEYGMQFLEFIDQSKNKINIEYSMKDAKLYKVWQETATGLKWDVL